MNNKNFSENNLKWDFILNGYVGGTFKASNLSNGFHGILKQWWEYYSKNDVNKVLLVSENNKVKKELGDLYNNWDITTLDLYYELTDSEPDIIADICSYNLIKEHNLENKYDLIINQAILEHVYNPFESMMNMSKSLKIGGHLITHTHAQNMTYHSYPSDYIRFMIDWWYDLPKYIENIKLIEFYQDDKDINVFSCYEKYKNG